MPAGVIVTGTAQEFLAGIARRRIASEEISSRAGIPQAKLRDPLNTLPLAAFTAMLEAAAYELSNSALGLELGKEFRPGALGPVFHLMRTAKTLGSALEKFNRFFDAIQTNSRSLLEIHDGTAHLSYSILDPVVRFRTQDAAFTLALEHAMLAKLAGADWRLSHVAFQHLAAEDLAIYKKHFDCSVAFRCTENALLFSSHLLEKPLEEANDNLHARLQTDLTNMLSERRLQSDLIESIHTWVAASLCRPTGTEIEVAAGDFGMSARSFQRKLAEHSVCFADIRNTVRCQIAQCMLSETTLPVTEIALKLGYSETSSFSRAFKMQMGETPTAFRRREQLGGRSA